MRYTSGLPGYIFNWQTSESNARHAKPLPLGRYAFTVTVDSITFQALVTLTGPARAVRTCTRAVTDRNALSGYVPVVDRTARIENEEGIWWGDPRSGQTSPGRGVLLGVLDGAIYARLAEAGRPRVFARGAVLMRQGEHAEEMYAIVSGRVSVERAHPALPKPLVLAELGPGDIVGEMGIVLEEPRSATVRALTDVTAIEVSREATLRAFVDLPGLPEVLRRLVARRLAQNDELLARQMAQNVELVAKRVARYVARSQDDLPA